MGRAVEVTQKMIQEAATYRDTLLQKLQPLAEDILTSGQVIARNFQYVLDIDSELQEGIQEEAPLAPSQGLAESSDKSTSAQPSKGTKKEVLARRNNPTSVL